VERLRASVRTHYNYRKHKDWGERCCMDGGRGVDHVIEVGGPGTLPQSIIACRMAAYSDDRVLTATACAHRALMARQQRLQGLIVGSRRHQMDLVRAIDAMQLKL